MNLPRIGSKVMGGAGGVPIIGRKKVDMADVPRFTGRQMQEFLFDMALGVTQYQAMVNLQLKAIVEELNLDMEDFEISQEELEAEAGKILPTVMGYFNQFEIEGEDEGIQGK